MVLGCVFLGCMVLGCVFLGYVVLGCVFLGCVFAMRVDACDSRRHTGHNPTRSQSQFEPLTGIWAEDVVLLHP